MSERRRNYICRFWLLAVLAGLLLLCVALKVPCLFRLLFDIPCPSCGFSRAWLSALQLQWGQAFGYHPMFWAIPVVALMWLQTGSQPPKWGRVLYLALAVLYVVCYVARLVAFFGGDTVV